MFLVFESSYRSMENIQELYIIHIIIALLTIIISLFFRKKIMQNKGFYLFFLFCFLIYYFLLEEEISIDKEIDISLKNKTYKIIEGMVTGFKPMPPSGHVRESFQVNEVLFFTDYGNTSNEKTKFFNLTKHYGSPIKENGQKVKIYYLEKKDKKVCLFFLPKCLEFEGENKIIKLWVNQERQKLNE